MLAELVTSLVQIIDLVLKRNDHRGKVDQDRVAKGLISILIDLERVEKNADVIRWQFFYMERDANSPVQVEKHKTRLRNFIPTQISTLYDLNERYKEFQSLFKIYANDKELPAYIAEHAFSAKQLYLNDLIRSISNDGENFSFMRSENSISQLSAIHQVKCSVANLIKEHIPIVDFVKWYAAPDIDFSQSELDRATAMRFRD
ncbi:hypothetical protein [Pseudomonas viridiflava]|uniref:hypothetical protein n=1 Tax=Pseudomonas viridiflava TaxID=33069 RepID=UPI000F05F906|nr:hypothetical protein [Pseudomonas viridiflava]